MSYARWATKDEVVEKLDAIDLEKEVLKAGIPIAYDDKYLYIDTKEAHNMIIGSTGSGKTQTTILPMLKLSMLAGDSVVVNDPKGELYEKCAHNFKERGYNVLALDFNDASLGNSWNPLLAAYEFYNKGNKDRAIKSLEDIGYYLFFDSKEKDSDPFWINSTINYFVGLTLYLFENATPEETNLNSIYQLSNHIYENDLSKSFLNKFTDNSLIYMNLAGTLNAPPETKGSILSVFTQKIKKYISREEISNMLSTSDFDLKDIGNKPTALFIVSGLSNYCDNLIPLLINQIVDYVDIYGSKEKHVNVLLDEFDSMVPIRNFSRLIEYCRSIKVRFTITIRSYIHLCNMYSKEDAAILKMCCGNLIYLLSDDIYTLEEISKYCGNKENGEPLVTIEDLKTINTFEGIVLMPRTMPYKTKFIPDFKINYGFQDVNSQIPERRKSNIQIFEEK